LNRIKAKQPIIGWLLMLMRLKKLFGIYIISLFPVCLFAQNDSVPRNIDYYLDFAVNSSPLLKDYGNQVLASRLDSLAIRAQNKPQLNANGQALFIPGGGPGQFGYDAAITNGGNYAAQVAATQNIFNKNLLKPQYQAVNLQGQALKNTSKLSEHDLRHNVTSQYINAWADQSQLQAAHQTLRIMKQQESLLKPLVQTGIMKQSAYLSFAMELQSQELTINQLHIQYEADLMTLNLLCGIADTSSKIRLQEPGLVKRTVRYDYFSSPVYMQYFIDSLQNINQKLLVDVRYKPHLSWMADAGFLSSTPDLYLHPGVSVGLALVFPIFDGGQRKLDYQRVNLQEKTRLGYVSFYKDQYNSQFVLYNKQLKSTEMLNDKINAQLRVSGDLINMSSKELNTGDISVTDFILILRNNIDLRNSLTQNRVKEWQVINDMNYYNW